MRNGMLPEAQRVAARDSLPPSLRKLVADPRHDRLLGLGASLAKPVVEGSLSGSQAYAALATAAFREELDGLLPQMWDALRNHAAWLRNNRAEIKYQISQELRGLIAERRPRNVLLARAHDVNAKRGRPFGEHEIEGVVVEEVWWSLPQARRHVRA